MFLACTVKHSLPEKGGACPAHAISVLGWGVWVGARRESGTEMAEGWPRGPGLCHKALLP